MFFTFFKFELNYWLRAMMVYVFTFIIGLLVFAAVSSDNVQIGNSGSMENTFRNSPHKIQMFYAVMAIFTTLMTTAFVNGAASRDLANNTNQLIYTKPIEKFGFLMGRYWGSTLVAAIPLLGISIGIILAQFMPWVEPEFWGPIVWSAHFWGIVMFAIPNTILVAAIIFAIAIWTRSTIASFVGALLLLVGYSVASSFTSNLDNETIGILIDPFGVEAFDSLTKYWTAAECNTQWLTLLPASGGQLMLYNRLIWSAVSILILAVAYGRFQFTERMRRGSARVIEVPGSAAVAIPQVTFRHDFLANLAQLWSQVRLDFSGIIRSNVFIVVALAFALQISVNLYFLASEGFGVSSLPVTYNVVGVVRASSYIFLLGTIVFYAGTLVWRERESQLDEVYDAAPQPTWISYAAKLISLVWLILLVQAVGMLAGLVSQAAQGYDRFQIGQYLVELFVVDFISLFCLSVLAMLAHIVSPNKYFGYFFFIFLVVANLFGWSLAEIETRMVRYGSIPGHTYSDMYGFAPFVPSMRGFYIYWILFTGILSSLAVLFWQRGRERGGLSRVKIAWKRWSGATRWVSLAALIVWSISACWVYYNVKVQNEFKTSEAEADSRADYEKRFKAKHEGVVQPRITKIAYEIDVYPERRGLRFHGLQTIENQSDAPIDTIFVAFADGYDTTLSLGEKGRSRVVEEHPEFDYYVYQLDPPLSVGQSMPMEFTVTYEPKGFEDSVSNTSLVQNGSFFNNSIAPQMGYQSANELSSKKERKEHGLEPQQTMPLLAPDDLQARSNTYLDPNSDWVEVETTISTSADQLAIAPGSLQRTWEAGGRRYFHYKLDHPSLNFYSFISARYAVEVRQWGEVDIEVYYHPEHGWNVPNMLESIKKSLEYYTEHFGPYRHKQARIIEFPRVASFAQAFPGTMPYSEGVGFIADIKDEDDIDMVFYIVAHEMAHQWWAHQVIGANMQGATLLSETLAQYSALMVMEKQFGRDTMRKFLQYEMDNYLRSRGSESQQEQPLKTVEAGQGYIHYRKGSCVMYYLKEMIGEERVNKALQNVIKKFAYQAPPYPTSVDLIEALKAETPAEYQYLYDDLFENITLFANRTVAATYVPRGGGKFDVTIEVECRKFQAGDKGEESEIAINDWIEIGAFAKPEEDRRYGRTLHRERVQVAKPMNRFTFQVELQEDEQLGEAGVDPFALLIDRMPSDNLRKLKPAS